MPKGSMPRPGSKVIKTTMNRDGSQQYIRGKTKSERLGTVVENLKTQRRANEDNIKAASDAAGTARFKKELTSMDRGFKASSMLDAALTAEYNRRRKK